MFWIIIITIFCTIFTTNTIIIFFLLLYHHHPPYLQPFQHYLFSIVLWHEVWEPEEIIRPVNMSKVVSAVTGTHATVEEIVGSAVFY
jgi:hypothetical protein